MCLQCRRQADLGSVPWWARYPGGGRWQPTPIILAWKIPWTEEPGGLQSKGLQIVGHDWATKHR